MKGYQKPVKSGRPRVQMVVFDLETGIKIVYPSLNETCKALGVLPSTICQYFRRNTLAPFKGRYLLEKL